MAQLKTIIEHRISPNLFNVFGCVGFWNDEGQKVYEQNKSGKMGSKFSQALAKSLPYESFVMNCLASELNTVINENEQVSKEYKTGKSGSHIWVSRQDNTRVILITIQ